MPNLSLKMFHRSTVLKLVLKFKIKLGDPKPQSISISWPISKITKILAPESARKTSIFSMLCHRASFSSSIWISILVEQVNFRAIRAKFQAILCLVSTLTSVHINAWAWRIMLLVVKLVLHSFSTQIPISDRYPFLLKRCPNHTMQMNPHPKNHYKVNHLSRTNALVT